MKPLQGDEDAVMLKRMVVGAVLVGGVIGLGWMLLRRKKQHPKHRSHREVLNLRITAFETRLAVLKTQSGNPQAIACVEKYLAELKVLREITSDDILAAELKLRELELKLRIEHRIPCT